LTVKKNINIPTCAALLCILHCTGLNGIFEYFSLEYCGVGPRTAAKLPSQAPFILSSVSTFIGLGPICVSKQASINIWFKNVVPLTCVRNLDCELLVV